MLYQIVSFLLHIVVGLVAGTCLLRAYLHYQRISMAARAGNPLGPFIFALTDWLVLPLRRLIPAAGRWDLASLVGAYLLELAMYGLLWLLGGSLGSPAQVVMQALIGLVRLMLSGMSGLLIVYAVLSWVQSESPMVGLIDRVVAPWLRPIRRMLPLVGGIDLSPLLLLVLLQVASMLLDSFLRIPY
ncbi:MAG: YggT family protein [Burkholderiaceae bacterium]